MTYQDKYGGWAGNPNGQKPDLARCCVEVGRPIGAWTQYGQCGRKRGFGPDGEYCKQHDPAEVAKRAKAADDKYQAERNQDRFKWYGRTFYDALQKIADGHNDARGLAQEVIEEFNKR